MGDEALAHMELTVLVQGGGEAGTDSKQANKYIFHRVPGGEKCYGAETQVLDGFL